MTPNTIARIRSICESRGISIYQLSLLCGWQHGRHLYRYFQRGPQPMNHQTLTRICKGLNVTWDTVIKEPGVLEVKVTDLAFFMDISIEEATRMLQGKEHEPTFADLAEVLKNENINPAD